MTVNDDTKHIQEAIEAKEYHRLPWLITYREQLHQEELSCNRAFFCVVGAVLGALAYHLYLFH